MRTDSTQARVWDTLTTILKMRGEKYSSLRLFAARALGELGNPTPDVLDALCRVAEKETDGEMVLEAVQALRELSVRDPQVEAALVATLKRTDDTRTKVAVIEALGDMQSSQADDPAVTLLKADIGAPMKKRILYSLSLVGGEAELSTILDAVQDASLRDYAEGVLEDADPTTLATLIHKRQGTETNKDVLAAMDSSSAALAAQ